MGKTIAKTAKIVALNESEGIYIQTTDGKEVAVVMDIEEGGVTPARGYYKYDAIMELDTGNIAVMDLDDKVQFYIKDEDLVGITTVELYRRLRYIELLEWVMANRKDKLEELGLLSDE